MQIVIDIPEQWEKCNIRFIKEGIRNGTPLPKGHGRLIDADKIKFEYLPGSNEWIATEAQIDNQTTIIEADNAESEE